MLHFSPGKTDECWLFEIKQPRPFTLTVKIKINLYLYLTNGMSLFSSKHSPLQKRYLWVPLSDCSGHQINKKERSNNSKCCFIEADGLTSTHYSEEINLGFILNTLHALSLKFEPILGETHNFYYVFNIKLLFLSLWFIIMLEGIKSFQTIVAVHENVACSET